MLNAKTVGYLFRDCDIATWRKVEEKFPKGKEKKKLMYHYQVDGFPRLLYRIAEN
jgi:hypothetical protein